MRTATFTLERENNITRVYSDIRGYCIWGTDLERVLASVAPLAQHLFWVNEKECTVPKNFDPTTLLEGKPVMVQFETIPRLRAPDLLVEGHWWKTPGGRNFFIVTGNGQVDKKSAEKLFAEIRAENNTS